MPSENDPLLGSTSRPDSTRSTPGIARRPNGFTSLQLLKQNKEKKAKRMQAADEFDGECDGQNELHVEMVAISTQTDNTMVMVWMKDLMSSTRHLVARRRVCACKWYDYIIGRHIFTTFYFLLIIAILVFNMHVIWSICKKYERVSQYK